MLTLPTGYRWSGTAPTMSGVMAEGLKPLTIRYTPKLSSQKNSGMHARIWAAGAGLDDAEDDGGS